MYNNTSKTGDIGEAVAIAEFVKHGITVLTPFGQNVPYDLVFENGGRFYRVQCKTIAKTTNGETMRFHICRTNGFTGEHTAYSENDVDYFFLYCIENGYAGLVPVSEANKREFWIRIKPPKAATSNITHAAKDYHIEKQIKLLKEQKKNAAVVQW